ncbi:MAG: glycosyltransferase [Balneolaceae bacterium]|nr:MAG: glycosyltransferase [Balneolaceae bacterium]
MGSVLHYKTNFLNRSETFIHRLVSNHQRYEPAALCYKKLHFCDGLPVHEVPDTFYQKTVNSAAFHLNRPLPFYKKTVREQKPDIIHAHFGYDAYKMFAIARAEVIPLVVSFYGSDVSRLPGEFGWKKRYKKLAHCGARFIAASDFMKRQLISLGFPSEKISVIHFGLDLELLPYQTKAFSKLNILMAGRLVEKKGFEYALQAVALLKLKGVELPVTLFGDGPLLSTLKTLAKRSGIDSQITFKGFQPVEEIVNAHKNHSLFLAPSVTATDGDMEGLPNTILEAMASGTPVIATKHAAIPEAITHQKSGFLVDERDTEGIANTISEIIRGSHDLTKIAEYARLEIEKNFVIKKMVNQVEDVYDRVKREWV